MFIRSIVVAGAFLAFAVGCASFESEDETQQIIDNLIEAGFPADDIRIVEEKVYVGNDAVVSLRASQEMLESEPGEEQYRTNNLVGGGGVTICVNDQDFLFDAQFNAAFGQAIANYQNLNAAGLSRLAFRRVTGGPDPGCTFFIDVFLVGGAGGSAGFPEFGAPFPQANIGIDTIQFGAPVLAHVITHELGHCIGFRHSDFFDRSISCGGAPVNEGDGGVGAIHVPGTPTGASLNGSLMNSCFNGSENGLFTGTDITAIDVLY
jgi:Dual-action HEIGH metallo-peptidase